MGTNRNDWMPKSIGVSFHWTTYTGLLGGKPLSYAEAVDAFDTDRFVRDLKNAGVDHIIFTLTHAKQYLAYPCKRLEQLLPGRTTKRDLLGEITDGLAKEGIRFIAYYNHSCNNQDDPEWMQACSYFGDLDVFAGNICGIVEETSRTFGPKISGWWFDSAYSVDPRGPVNTVTCDMGSWRFPWQRLLDSARAGNPDSVVAVNPGIGSRFLYVDGQDYYAGESTRLDEPFDELKDRSLCDHRWTCIDDACWLFCGGSFVPPRYTEEQLKEFIADNRANHRMTTFNMQIDQTGLISPAALERFQRVRAAFD